MSCLVGNPEDGFSYDAAHLASLYYIHVLARGVIPIVPLVPGYINPLVTNGLSHPYQLDESIFIFMGVKDLNSTVAKWGSVFIGLMTPDGAIWFR